MVTVSERRVAAAFLAHPDDAEILCAGTLIRLADAGWAVHLVTATAGDCGSATLAPAEISAVRKRENHASAALIGATYHCLEEHDVKVVYDRPTIEKAIDLFRELAPTLVFTHAPKDYMLDHEMVSLLARNATFSYPIPNATALPIVAGSAIPHLYYCDPIEGVDPLGQLVQPTTWTDITEQLERKTAMLACHASQREWLRAHHGMDEYIDAMKRHGAMRGRETGAAYAEAFVQHRGHGYPRHDLLHELFGGRAT